MNKAQIIKQLQEVPGLENFNGGACSVPELKMALSAKETPEVAVSLIEGFEARKRAAEQSEELKEAADKINSLSQRADQLEKESGILSVEVEGKNYKVKSGVMIDGERYKPQEIAENKIKITHPEKGEVSICEFILTIKGQNVLENY